MIILLFIGEWAQRRALASECFVDEQDGLAAAAAEATSGDKRE
jgi:hypothetical protein